MKTIDKKSVNNWIYKNLKKFLPGILLMCLISSITSISFIFMAFLSKNVLEIAQNERSGNFSQYAIIFAIIVLLQVVLSSINSILKTYISGKLTISIRENLFSVMLHKKYSDVSKYHSGDILNRFTSDTDIIVANSVSILPDVFSMLTKIIGGAIALIKLEPLIAVIIILFGVLIPAFGRLISKHYKYLHKECQKTEGITRSFLQECFENNIVIKTFKSEVPFKEKLNGYMNENLKFKIKRALLSIASSISIYSFFTIGYYAILIWGAAQIATNAITFGTLVAFLQLISQLRVPLKNISGILPKYYSITASAERLVELENLEDETVDSSVQNNVEFLSINGENINFSYGNKTVLSDFNFKINKSSLTAVIGRSGCGKSTLFKLILGLYELNNGKIVINNTINANFSTRQLFAYVPQGNMILSGSIKDNITLCNPNITDDKLFAACKTAQIHDYILSLPDGYDTVLSERGGGFSEGQLQRLSIARALLTDAPVLLLDEATSALDCETELQVLKNIKSLKEKTVILVTHRKTSIDFCDNIISI